MTTIAITVPTWVCWAAIVMWTISIGLSIWSLILRWQYGQLVRSLETNS